MQIYFYILLFILGACFGSFLCCQARRLHLRSSHSHKTKLGKRSVCLHCHCQLKWYDNIPIMSWLFLRGKCRNCKTKIGIAELLSEIAIAFAFLALGTTIDVGAADIWQWVIFIAILIFTTIIGFLAIYDGLYGELPTAILIVAIVTSIIILAINEAHIIIQSGFTFTLITDPLLSVLILGGLYLVLYLISKGKWVGDGDWLLGTALAIALFHPLLALVTLFLANLLGSLVMAPTVIMRKNHRIYFGPFLVIAFVIVYCLADSIKLML